ncbi:uncharacterized protein K02A2.6-like [Ostrea edulis]|uniref:uncharacterized protein K02A2.6-like n=1 Tax=Ostrea edulis TaxID=37623 RepID=UPI0024AF5052|nr:uncharacterized protein K02A2.6-like [Ostrea edulis]
MKLNEFKTHTDKDPMLRELRSSLKSGDWTKFAKSKNSDWKSLYKLRDEFTLADTGITLRNTRILTPKSLIKRVVELAHEGHQGVVKTKSLLREKVCFPGIDKIVESTIKSCIPCQATVETKRIEPLQMSPLPSGPWTEVSTDFCGPFPSGDYLMVVIDSRYPVVEILKSISAKSVLTRLDKIFAEFGIPCTLKSDNGPPFNGSEFKQFAEYLGFKHRKITPLWPKANAESERFMRTIEKTIRASNVESKNWKQEIYTFLRHYRATPHCTTKLSPFEILFGRTLKTKLDVEIITERKGEEIETKTDIRKNDEKAKMQMKQYADSKSGAKENNLEIGDNVLIKQNQTNKMSTPYNPNPMEIINKKGTLITARNEDREITRNASHFKEVNTEAINDREIDNAEDKSDDIQTKLDPKPPYELRRSRKAPKHLEDFVCD